MDKPLFKLGMVVVTPGAKAACEASGEDLLEFLIRHVTGDYGTVCAEDVQANREAIRLGNRVLSAYVTRSGVGLYCITEADRSSTCLMRKDEY